MLRPAKITRAAIVTLCFGLAAAYAQPGEHGSRGDQKKEKNAKPDKPGKQGREAAPPQRARPAARPSRANERAVKQPEPRERSREQAEAWQKQRGWLKNGGWKGHDSWQKNRAKHWVSEHRTWAQRGGYGGYYIPRDRFGMYFGPAHFFRIRTRPVIYMGFPRFEYSGFSFLLVDPWPETWAENWYDSDDVYIDFDDGYYLYNRRRPGVRLAITVAL
jgi:hypothetical protein